MINVTISKPQKLAIIAIDLINKFLIKNNIKDFNLEIVYDYDLKDDDEPLRGIYYYCKPSKIFINPLNCEDHENTNAVDSYKFYCGYTKDLTLYGVIIHEFCHCIIEERFKPLTKDYCKEFSTQRLYLNDYSDNAIDDEIAEAMTLYLTNPYLLKMISKDHFNFFKKYFFSPLPSSNNKLYLIYNSFPQSIKLDLNDRWKIYYNFELNKFEKKD